MTDLCLAALRRCWMLLALCSLPALAADPAPMNAQFLKTGLYLIQGAGGNSLMRFSQAGLILVDGQPAGAYKDFMSQVRKLNKFSDLPVRALVLTGSDENRTGDLGRYAAAQVVIVAPASTRHALDARPADPPPHYVVFDDNYLIRMGGIEVQVLQLGKRRDGGETVVYFPGQKVVAMGDLGRPDATANDAAWSAALAALLQLDFDTAVPREGAPLARADVVALRARLDAGK